MTTPEKGSLAGRRFDLSEDGLLRDCDLEFFTGPGPGGQHRNKSQTAVRLRHRPSGVTVVATERRSQAQNRSAALRRLREKLLQLTAVPKKRRPSRPTRASKRRRLETKTLLKGKKAARRKVGEGD